MGPQNLHGDIAFDRRRAHSAGYFLARHGRLIHVYEKKIRRWLNIPQFYNDSESTLYTQYSRTNIEHNLENI